MEQMENTKYLGNNMNNPKMIEKSIEKVKRRLQKDLDLLEENVKRCYSYAETPFEEQLVDIMIDSYYYVASKDELYKRSKSL